MTIPGLSRSLVSLSVAAFSNNLLALFGCYFACASLAGCGTSDIKATLALPGLSGQVRGGQQPIAGSIIQLYAAENDGGGSASTPLIAHPTQTNAKGQFDIGAFVCPSASTNVYLTATGGNPGLQSGAVNPAIAEMVALGPCGNITPSTFVNLSELSTVAAVYALAPFMTSFTAIGSSQSDSQLLSDAFALAGEMVDPGTGAVPGVALPLGQTVPVLKIRALANILSSCINSSGGLAGDGTNCGTLFTLTTRLAGKAPVDTIQAMLNVAKNPSFAVNPLYLLSPSVSPFMPTLTSAPTDWTIDVMSPTAAPVILPVSGSYPIGTPVILSDSNTKAAIYYTSDGSTPTTSSHPYTGAIALSAAGMIRAVAEWAGVSSVPTVGSYTLQTPTMTLSPLAVTLEASQTQTYTANISGLSNTALTWSLKPAIGIISTSGLYTAPSSITSAQSVAVTATSVADSALSSTSTISLIASPVAVATHLAFLTQPSDTTLGANIAPAVTVVALDASGNPVTTTNYPVTVEIQNNPGGGILYGTAVTSTAAYFASFSALSITAAGSGYTLVASSPGLASATSTSFNINPAAAASAASYSGLTPVSALTFVDTVGINVHLNFGNTVYTNNFPLILSSLKSLGIRHVRDGLLDYGSGPSAYYTAHNALGVNGIKTDYITSINEAASVIEAYPSRVNDMEAVEAPNEYDVSGDPLWAVNLAAYLPVLFNAVHGSSPMSGVTVVGPSLVNPNWNTNSNSYVLLGLVASLFDQGNLHNYYGGRNPGTPGWTPQGYGSIPWAISTAQTTWFSTPLTTTETGYYDDPSLTNSVPDSVIANYVPRVFLEQYQKGVSRTYLYELADDLPGGNYGLLRADGSVKPAFSALLHFMQLLADPGAAYSTKPITYGVSGSSSDVHQMLFQKRDGSYLLALWIEEPGYDVNAKSLLTVPSRSISVNFPNSTHIKRVYQQQPNGDSKIIIPALSTVYSTTVTVSDEITVLEIAAP